MSAPITAWRYWRVGIDGFDFSEHSWDVRLRGDFEVWDGPLKDSNHRGSDHRSPSVGCLCGVNAVKRIRSRDLLYRAAPASPGPWLVTVSKPSAVAFAQVDLGGRVDEYEEGYRAEQALIAGPIYVVNPPTIDGWREALERRYGQPVITQELDEALEWVREDEEANGYREAHQDARAGAFAGTGGISVAGNRITFGSGTFTVAKGGGISFGPGGTITGFTITRDESRAKRAYRRARTRLGKILGHWATVAAVAGINVGFGTVALMAGDWAGLFNLAVAALLIGVRLLNRHLRLRRGLTFDDLKPWLRAHGAKNDRVTSITMDLQSSAAPHVGVTIEGIQTNWLGRPYLIGADKVATWKVTTPLRRVP